MNNFPNKENFHQNYKEFLKNAVTHSPVINSTGRHRLMISVVNKGMIDMTKNFLCSLFYSKVKSNEFILFATDKESYNQIKPFFPSVFFLQTDLSKEAVNNQQIVQFYRFLHVRTQIALDILKYECDVITCDTDIVFLSHFQELIQGDADLEAQHDSKFFIYPEQTVPAPWKLNLGFHCWRSNNLTIEIVTELLEKMKTMPKNHDQSVLRKMTRKYPNRWTNDSVLELGLGPKKTPFSKVLRVRYIDGMKAVNAGGIFTNNSVTWIREARKRKIRKPTMCHFFHIGSLEDKYYIIKKANLWFLNRRKNQCLRKPPEGTEWHWWI